MQWELVAVVVFQLQVQHRAAHTDCGKTRKSCYFDHLLWFSTPGFWVSHDHSFSKPTTSRGTGTSLQIQTPSTARVTWFPVCCSLGECCWS